MIAKSWMADGLQVWLQDEATIFLSVGTQSYSLGAGGDHASASSIKTEVKTAVSSGTTLDVDSTTGMTAADNIGLELDDGTMHWTTIASVTDSDTVELTDAVPSAAAVDNHVYTYTTLLTRPLRITEAWHVDESNEDTPLLEMSRKDYVSLSTKSTQGRTTQFFYDRQLTNGIFHVWPTADNLKHRIKIYFHREVHDFDSSTDDPDFPKHYLRALKFALASDIGDEYGVPVNRLERWERKAYMLKEEAMMFDVEDGSIQLGIDDRG